MVNKQFYESKWILWFDIVFRDSDKRKLYFTKTTEKYFNYKSE